MTTLYLLTGPEGSGKTTYLKSSESIQSIDIILDDNGTSCPNEHIPHHPIINYKIDEYVLQQPDEYIPFTYKTNKIPVSHQKLNKKVEQFFNKYENTYNNNMLANLLTSIIPTHALTHWGYIGKTNKLYEKPSFTQLSEPGESNVYFATKLPKELLIDFKEKFSHWIDIEIIQFPLKKGN